MQSKKWRDCMRDTQDYGFASFQIKKDDGVVLIIFFGAPATSLWRLFLAILHVYWSFWTFPQENERAREILKHIRYDRGTLTTSHYPLDCSSFENVVIRWAPPKTPRAFRSYSRFP